MTMSTPTLAEASRLLATAILRDTLQILTVGPPVTVGIQVTRSLTSVGLPVQGLVQTTTLANAVESRIDVVYSVKVRQNVLLMPGQAVRVVTCVATPSLVGKVLLIDKVTENGLAMIVKGIASDFHNVNQEGKGALA